jgi:serine-type D-Ala-D-Ala carboxypeptidase/endopeptidase (penicillin-binding protein 4)
MGLSTPQLRFKRAVAALGVVTAVVVGAAPAGGSDVRDTPLPPAITAIMAKAQYANASWGLLDLDPSGAVVHSRRADEMFIPGSTTKLFSVSAVWNVLGPDHRFTTPVYALGRRRGGTLKGNLVLVGVGDLSLGGRTTRDGGIAWEDADHSDANAIPGAVLTPQDPLAGIKELARQVRKAGITRVSGDVVIDDRLFRADFEPQPTPVMLNDNLIDLVATPTSSGRKASFFYRPRAASLSVDADVRTVAAGGPTRLNITGGAPGRIRVTGTIAEDSKPFVQVAPIADPAVFARTVFIQALRRAGVRVDAPAEGRNQARKLPAASSYRRGSRVAAYVSPPYADYAKLILKVSHNLGANLGICLLAVTAGSKNCDAGFAPMKTFLDHAGVDLGQVAFADGRGGDPADRATPTAVAQLLRYWIDQPDFAVFRATLPILGVDGSLKNVAVQTAARGKVLAKTGTAVGADLLNLRLVVQGKALGGYFQQADGGWHVFDVVVNDAGGGPGVGPALDAGEDVGEIAAHLWEQANK